MLGKIFKGMLAKWVNQLLENYRQRSLQLLRLEGAKCYLHALQMARVSAIGLMRMGLYIALIGCGGLLLHAGLLILLPWSAETKAILAMALGLAYVIIAGLALRSLLSQKKWMEKSGAADMLEVVIHPPERRHR